MDDSMPDLVDRLGRERLGIGAANAVLLAKLCREWERLGGLNDGHHWSEDLAGFIAARLTLDELRAFKDVTVV